MKKLNIFISYATMDSDYFEIPKIAKLMEKSYPDINSVLYWEEAMDDDIMVYMNDNLGLCDVVVVFCSERSLKSDAVRMEWMAAYKMKKKLIPIFVDDSFIPPLLTTKLGVRFIKGEIKVFIGNLHNLIKKKLNQSRTDNNA